MPNGMRWVGLDVHAHASAVAVFDDVTGEVITRRVVGRPTVSATMEARGRDDLAQSGLGALAAEHSGSAQAGPRAASTASRTRSGPKRITSSATTPQACSVAASSARAARSSSAAVLSATAATRAGRTGRQTAS
jgi:hypothetical protein